MASQPKGPSIHGHDAAQVMRPARALLGWMAAPEAQLVLAGRRVDKAEQPEHIQRSAAARDSVADRPRGCNQDGIVGEPTGELDGVPVL